MTTRYISPSGAGSCTSPSPCSFTTARNASVAGDTIIVKNGTYNENWDITCGGNAVDGTSGAGVITVQAENEREALIQGNASGADTLKIASCSYWTIEGLRIQSVDNIADSGWGDCVWLNASDHITFRRCLLRRNNRYANVQMFLLINSSDNLFEECEMYDWHRNCFNIDGHRNVVRRCYANSRLSPDIGSVHDPSNSPTRGDGAFLIYSNSGQGDDNIIENCISENNWIGFRVAAASPIDNNRFFGCISLNDTIGMSAGSREAIGTDTAFTNCVSIASENNGYWNQVGENSTCTNCSVFSTQGLASHGAGFYATDDDGAWGSGATASFTCTNCLAMNNAGYGYYMQVTVAPWTFSLNYTAGSGNTPEYDPAPPDAGITNQFTDAPTNLGSCYCWIPDLSNLKNAGLAGADIGANILYRYEDGVLGSTPLWNPATGEFPCGEIISGVNDAIGDSCFDVHERLNINTGGCLFPSGYAPTGIVLPVFFPLWNDLPGGYVN